MSQFYVDLAVPVAVDKLFSYIVPQELQRAVKSGVRAIAPFGKRTVVGLIIRVSNSKPAISNLKPIYDVIDAKPIFSDDLLHLTRWMSDYYFVPLGEVLKAILVQGTLRASKRTVRLNASDVHAILSKLGSPPKQDRLSSRHIGEQATIIKEVSKQGIAVIAQLKKKLRIKSIYSLVNELARQGYVVIEEKISKPKLTPKYERVIEINPTVKEQWQAWLTEVEKQGGNGRLLKQISAVQALHSLKETVVPITTLLKATHTSLSTLRTLERKNLLTISQREVIRTSEYDLYQTSLGAQNIVLNAQQQCALEKIEGGLRNGKYTTYLLHGVTGSGKTQVYIEATREALGRGKSVIILVPEISLTPQIVRRFKFYFGDKVVALHSKMSLGERYDAWRLARDGKYSVVIGPRSAVFAPLNNLGLIVVDEEQESSFKQFDQLPRYHARDVAIMRAKNCNAVVVLGSATPSLESYSNALRGKYTLLELPERVDKAQLPRIEIVDLTEERKKLLNIFIEERRAAFAEDPAKARADKKRFEFGSISELLKKKIEDRLQKKEGIILLQNRRGFSPFIECPDCGYVEMCDNCNITLTYHLTKKHLRCHYCGAVKQPPEVCPKCKGTDIRYRGFGTQRVEDELEKLFPQAYIVRMDLDTTSRRGAHDKILKEFSEGHADILLGTQMVAKGLDFSRVTLVGVISADTQLLLPDFRSVERTFQLMTQVAGRAGRSAIPGEVVIQTYQSNSYCLHHVLTHDFKSFYKEELEYRRELNYPPFSRLILIEFKGKREIDVMNHVLRFASLLKQQNSAFITLGPAPATIARLKGMYRWHIVVKDVKSIDPSGQRVHQAITSAMKAYGQSTVSRKKSVKLVIDVDPIGMM
ncbi:MAG: primosomal protein N' [Ignavibacteriae bacterium]|nr:primosomal protein N' [Ignavibacteriota bacterium]